MLSTDIQTDVKSQKLKERYGRLYLFTKVPSQNLNYNAKQA